MRTRKQHFVSQILVGAARAIAVAAAMTFLLATAETGPAEAQTLTVLYRFKGPTDGDGAGPFAAPTLDNRHNLYGTTESGGSSNRGTVFKIDASGSETVLYSFTGGADGFAPVGSLILDQHNNLYGTTSNGGADGWGTVFKLDPFGRKTVLYSFKGTADGDGAIPSGNLAMDNHGNLYGTTIVGGISDFGTAFKLDSSGKETVLHRFTGPDGDGSYLQAGLVFGRHGVLYGTTRGNGGSGISVFGTVFKVLP